MDDVDEVDAVDDVDDVDVDDVEELDYDVDDEDELDEEEDEGVTDPQNWTLLMSGALPVPTVARPAPEKEPLVTGRKT